MKKKDESQNIPVRIKDIALKANVSTGTVDRVLHNRGRVAKDVKERVLKIVAELNYEPNIMARMLVSTRVYNFAALIPSHIHDNFWLGPKQGIERAEHELKSYGVKVKQFVFDPQSVEDYVKKAEELTQEKPDGILLSPLFYKETLAFFEKWTKEKIPFVLFNTQIVDYDPLSYIGQDSYQSGLVAGKLVHYGQPQPCSILIAHIDEEISNAQHLVKKEAGFRNYFAQKDLGHQYNIIRVELKRASQSGFIKKLDEVIEKTLDLRQIFVTTSQAYDVAKYLEQRHVTNIKVIGYDLVPQNLHYLKQGNISFLINQNPKGQGFWGINQLAEHVVFKREVPILKYLPLDIVTLENLNYFLDEKDPTFLNF